MKVKVDPAKCSGIGLCEIAASTVYEVGDDGQSHVLKDEPSAEELRADLHRARTGQPVLATPVLPLDQTQVVSREARPTTVLPAVPPDEEGRGRRAVAWTIMPGGGAQPYELISDNRADAGHVAIG